jgi:hypothetical protein
MLRMTCMAAEHSGDGGLDALMRVRDHRLHAGQATSRSMDGIGPVGTFVPGIAFFQAPAALVRMLFVGFIPLAMVS